MFNLAQKVHKQEFILSCFLWYRLSCLRERSEALVGAGGIVLSGKGDAVGLQAHPGGTQQLNRELIAISGSGP